MRTVDRHWFGTLTVENAHAVTSMIHAILDGTTYTNVTVHEPCKSYYGRVEVRTNQKLTPKDTTSGDAVKCILYKDEPLGPGEKDWPGRDRHVHIMINDTYGCHSLSSSAGVDGNHNDYEHAYIVFEWDKVTVKHKSGAGAVMTWVFAVCRGCTEHSNAEICETVHAA